MLGHLSLYFLFQKHYYLHSTPTTEILPIHFKHEAFYFVTLIITFDKIPKAETTSAISPIPSLDLLLLFF